MHFISNVNTVFLILIEKMDEVIENVASSSPFDVEELPRLDVFISIWDMLDNN